MEYSLDEVMETVRMTLYHNFDIRTVTLGINLKDCIDPDIESFKSNVYDKVTEYGKKLVNEAGKIEDKYGIPIINKRISVTPVSLIVESCKEDAPLEIAKTLDMAGAFHGIGEPDFSLNIGISGPGVVRSVVEKNRECDLTGLSEVIKRTAFKITRAGELIGRELASNMEVPFGIVDISLASTNKVGDSVAGIVEMMGIERIGAPGSTAALALLIDAVKKGGAMASGNVGGLSGTFIPVSEDSGMNEAVKCRALSIEKLEALTAVCSVGLDMIAIPGDTPAETISAIIADELSIGVVNGKTTGVRLIPVPGKKAGDYVNFGGLLGETYVMDISTFSSRDFILRGGRMPAPITSMRN